MISPKWQKFFKYFGYVILFFVFLWLTTPTIYTNDYLNPFTLTFKNPKTIQMLNIIILYHYVMAFLVAIIVFTFIFIFLSFFRSYPFFYSKYGRRNFDVEGSSWLVKFVEVKDRVEHFFHEKKKAYMEFYKNDIKKAIDDQVTHAPILEFLWVVFPAIILILIAYPSVMMLYYNEAYVNPVFNISAVGNQWYWTYEYNDFNLLQLFRRMLSLNKPMFMTELQRSARNVLEFVAFYDRSFKGHAALLAKDGETLKDIPLRPTVDCNLIIAKDPKFLRLLSTDQCLVLPSKTPVRILITSSDVIHSWAVPSYGVKLDAVPGRINQQILNIPLVGTSWGQCSELCGVNHAFMPIEIKVLSFGDFLFYMELKVKEILTPYMVKFCRTRLNIIEGFVRFLRENADDPRLNGVMLYKDQLEELLNSKNLVKYKKN